MWKPWEDFERDQEAAALAVEDSVREWAAQDSLAQIGVETRKKPKPGQGFIQFAPEDSMGFAKMVMALEKVRQGGSARILHFGDSQIEGDRITGDLRDALQRVYGGEGPRHAAFGALCADGCCSPHRGRNVDANGQLRPQER